MSVQKIVLFIDGANTFSAMKNLGINCDWRRVLTYFNKIGVVVSAYYYTAMHVDKEDDPVVPLTDFLDYNGFLVVSKDVKEFYDEATGRRKIKGNMDVELCVDAMTLAPSIDHMVLFSGDGDFRALVEAIQKRGVFVTVVSTIKTQPPMIADELRRQASRFLDIIEMEQYIRREREGVIEPIMKRARLFS